MIKPAFSTVAFPDWTLDRVAAFAGRSGYLGVELRTFGHGSVDFTPEPCLTGAAKLRDLFEDAGADLLSLATSIRYDEQVFPPVVGYLFNDGQRAVTESKAMVQVAAAAEIPFVRVYAFELEQSEKRGVGLRRIIPRLDLALRTARHSGVRMLIENGGSFPKAEDLIEIIERVGNPLLGACYNPAVAAAAGEDPVAGAASLLGALEIVRLSDMRDGEPCDLGEGDLPTRSVIEGLAGEGFDGWAVFEHPRLWRPELGADEAEGVLSRAADTMYGWTGVGSPAPQHA